MEPIRAIQRTLAGAALVAAAMVLATLPVRAQQLPTEAPLFIAASVDNDRPYIGQQIIYTSKIYQRLDFPHPFRYQPPDFAGFWNVHTAEPDEYSETIESKEYRVIELRTLLFPSVVETIEIAPGALTVSAVDLGAPGGVESTPVVVEVRPTPPGAPAEFTGAVGRFAISAEVDVTTIRMNESALLTVKVEGEGNIDALPEPSWPEFHGWRAVRSPAVISSEIIAGRLAGSRAYEIVLVPETAGGLTAPEVLYTYYDPDLEEYVQAKTSPIVVTVAEVDGAPSAPPSSVGGTEEERSAAGAKPNKAAPHSLRRSAGDMTGTAIYWAMWTLPLIVIVGAAVWRRRRDAWEAALADSRRRNALPNAQSALARAAADGEERATAAADALSSYVSDRLGVSLTGLTRARLGLLLRDAGAPVDLAQRVEDVLASGEAARYTPETSLTGQSEDHVERAIQLLTELDGAIET